MGFLDLTRSLDNLIASHYSDARGPVIRGEYTELALVHFEAGEGGSLHSHEAEQFIFVLEGLIHFDVGDDSVDVGAGQAYFVPSGVPHATKALQRSRAISFKNLSNPAYDATARAE